MIKNIKTNKKVEKIKTREKIPVKNKEGRDNFILVALDTCVVIDMAFFCCKSKKERNQSIKREYLNALGKLLQRNVMSKMSRSSNICFCITPGVRKELTSNKGKYFGRVKKFVERNIVLLEVNENAKSKFSGKVDLLVDKYCEKGYFLENKLPTVDAINVAEASYFNLYLLSNDHHICTYRKDEDPRKKIEDIREINRSQLAHEYRSVIAAPQRPEQFIRLLNSGKKMAKPKRLDELELGSKTKIVATVPKQVMREKIFER